MDNMDTLFCNIVSFDWASIVKCILGLFAVLIARSALSTWKEQLKANRVDTLLDELTDSVHEYMESMNVSLGLFDIVKMTVDSYKKAEGPNSNGVLDYIERHGKNDSSRIIDTLDKCKVPAAKIRSLVAKGQTLKIKNYEQCYESCMAIIATNQKVYAFTNMISGTRLNWGNAEVRAAYDKVLLLNPEDLSTELNNAHEKYILFVTESYVSIFK